MSRARPPLVAIAVAVAVAIAAPSASARPPRRASSTAADHIASLVDEWRFEEADTAFAALRASAPEAPSTLYLDAMLRFHRGDYDGAAERIAVLRDRHGAANAAADEAWRDFAELIESTRTATRGYAEARSPEGHFLIRYQPGRDELLLPYAFEALESARREIGERDFQAAAQLGSPVRVEIFPEVADLAKVSTLTLKEIETSGTIAVCKFNKLMVTSPRALVHGYPWLDTLSHEFTHFVITRVSHNSVPIWLHEGLAKYEERRWRLPSQAGNKATPTGAGTPGGANVGGGGESLALSPTMEHLLASAITRGKRLITFEEMSPSMAKLPSQEDTALAFAEVYTVIEYLLEHHGWEGVRGVVAQLRDGAGDAAAVSSVVGQPFDEFQRAWRTWLRGRKLRVHPGLVPAPLKFARHARGQARRGGAERDRKIEDADDAEDVGEERARKLVRLGGMLRGKNRLAAAAVEYGKAQQLVGAGHVVVAGKLARTLLGLGDADGAIAAAMPAYELYPEQGGLASVLGEAWLKKGEPSRALPFLEAALRTNPFDPAPHCALATLYEAKAAASGAPSGTIDARGPRERRSCSALAE